MQRHENTLQNRLCLSSGEEFPHSAQTYTYCSGEVKFQHRPQMYILENPKIFPQTAKKLSDSLRRTDISC